jgi:hypothetical protein
MKSGGGKVASTPKSFFCHKDTKTQSFTKKWAIGIIFDVRLHLNTAYCAKFA